MVNNLAMVGNGWHTALAGVVLGVGSTSVYAGLGVLKASEAADDFTAKFGEIIRVTASHVTMRTKALMENQLERSFAGSGAHIMLLLEQNGMVSGVDIDYHNCPKIKTLDLQQFTDQQDAVFKSCQGIAAMMSDAHMVPLREQMSKVLSQRVLADTKYIIKEEVVKPVAALIAQNGVHKIKEIIVKNFPLQKAIEEFEDNVHTAQEKIEQSNNAAEERAKNDAGSDDDGQNKGAKHKPAAGKAKPAGKQKPEAGKSKPAGKQKPSAKQKPTAAPSEPKNDHSGEHTNSHNNNGPEQTAPESASSLASAKIAAQKQELLNDLFKQLKNADKGDGDVYLKRADETYIVLKHGASALTIMGKEQFAKKFPEVYNKLAGYKDAAGNFIAVAINKADGSLGKLLGHKYDNFKAKAGALLAEIDRTAPQIVSDGIRVIAFGAAGEAAVGAALKGASKLKGKIGNICDKNFPGAISEDLGDAAGSKLSKFDEGLNAIDEFQPHKYGLDVPPYQKLLKDKADFVGEYDFYKYGPLEGEYAGTFTGYSYKAYKLHEDTVIYRAGKSGTAFGEYFSFENPISELQVRIDKAIMHEWPDAKKSIIDTVFAIKIPKGTEIFIGKIKNQGSIYLGGTEQILIPKPWLLEGAEVVYSYRIKGK